MRDQKRHLSRPLLFTFTFAFCFFSCCLCALADTDHVTIREDSSCHNLVGSLSYVNVTDATIASPTDARVVLDTVKIAKAASKAPPPLHLYDKSLTCDAVSPDLGAGPKAQTPNFDAKDFYCLIHILRWKDPSTSDDTKPQAVDKQNWYVYHAGKAWRLEDFNARNRVFGSKNLWLLFVHLNGRSNYKYEVRYDLDLKDVTPAPLNDALALAGVVAGGAQASSTVQNLWGLYPINVSHLPNETTVQSEVYGNDSTGALSLQKTSTTPPVFVNEGRYHYDFGIAVPVKGISQTTVSTTNNTLTPKTTSVDNAFAVIDLYPYPNDVRNTTFSYYPYLIAGVAMASQPLHKILLAAGWGPAFTQFYVGALLVKQQSVSGTAVTSNSGYEPQFSVGINLSVKAFNGLLKKSR